MRVGLKLVGLLLVCGSGSGAMAAAPGGPIGKQALPDAAEQIRAAKEDQGWLAEAGSFYVQFEGKDARMAATRPAGESVSPGNGGADRIHRAFWF